MNKIDTISVPRETLLGLRDAYISYQVDTPHGSTLRDRLESWLDELMDNIGETEYMRDEMQKRIAAYVKRNQTPIDQREPIND